MLTSSCIPDVTDSRILTEGFKIGGVNGHGVVHGSSWVTALEDVY
jgi:hypothetical protein